MSVYLSETPLELHLTKQFLLSKGFPPLYGGAFWKMRFQILDRVTQAGKDLTSAKAVMVITDGETTITRESGVASTSAPTNQIVFDDQTEETTDPTTGEPLGTGWLSVYCYAVAVEVAEFATLFESLSAADEGKRCSYEIAIKFVDDVTQHPIFAGKVDVLRPKNTFPIP